MDQNSRDLENMGREIKQNRKMQISKINNYSILYDRRTMWKVQF